MKKVDKKLKVLCLHGYRQDSTKFRQQTGSLRKLLKNIVDFDYISAPFSVPSEGEASRSWWFTSDSTFSSRDSPEICSGLEESVKIVHEAWSTNGPYDGLLGFSQGACFVGILAAMIHQSTLPINPKFIVLVSAFKSKCKAHTSFYENKLDIPSLHVFGEGDEVIPFTWSKELAECYLDPIIMQHSGGHYVPGNSIYKSDYHSFFNRINDEY